MSFANSFNHFAKWTARAAGQPSTLQNTQNRDAVAMHIKLDELIRAVKGAHNELVDLEEMTEEELEQMKVRYTRLAERARARLRNRPRDSHDDDDQAETGSSRGSGKAATKASTASGSS
jgi:low affinity Fe/Cu permease